MDDFNTSTAEVERYCEKEGLEIEHMNAQESGTIFLLGSGLAGMFFWRRKQGLKQG